MRVTPPPPPRGGPLPDAARRLQAIETVRARFEGKALALGRTDCLKLARATALAMGHRGLPKVPAYRTALGARRALGAVGADDLSALMDRHFERIAPAAMRMADVGLVDADEEWARAFGGSLVISLGHKLWGWHPDQPELAVIDPVPGAIRAAWRL